MSTVRERLVNIIENLPYELEEEINKRETIDILKEITKKYAEEYGIEDLCESDKECIRSLIEKI